MFFSDWRPFSHRPTRVRRSRGLSVRCEELEPRLQPSAIPFFFSTGSPDGQIATLSRTASTGKLETETADDFVTTLPTNITDASFIGLLVGARRRPTFAMSRSSSITSSPSTRPIRRTAG